MYMTLTMQYPGVIYCYSEGKMQYFLTLQVSKYCLFPLQSNVAVSSTACNVRVRGSFLADGIEILKKQIIVFSRRMSPPIQYC